MPAYRVHGYRLCRSNHLRSAAHDKLCLRGSQSQTRAGRVDVIGALTALLVTFDPGLGQQGLLTGSGSRRLSNAVNAPITIDTAGTGSGLAASQTKFVVSSGPQVITTTLTVTVSPVSGP